MFPNQGPVGAHNALRRFLMDNKSGYTDIREKLITASEEISVVAALTTACEILLAGLAEKKVAATARPAALSLLGEMSARCADGYWHGKADRWNALANWAASEINGGNTATPDVDPAYTTIAQPAPIAPAPALEAPPQ